MAQVRTVTYTYRETVSAGGSVDKYVSKLLRDILWDQAFDLLWITARQASLCGAGDPIGLELSKNVTPLVAPVEDVWLSFHGIIQKWYHFKLQAENVYDVFHDQLMFPQPIPFDRDDDLNVRMSAMNTGTGAYYTTWYLTLGYRAR